MWSYHKVLGMKQKRIGIFSGVFDPVHAGHIGFALEAIKQARLDKVYFLVEARPRRKTVVTHVAHRLAMVKLAVASHTKLTALEQPDRQFSVAKTLPRLKQQFADSELIFLVGSDTLEHMPDWPLVRHLLGQTELIVGRRDDISESDLAKLTGALPEPKKLYIVTSPSPNISSGQIRKVIRQTGNAGVALPSLRTYITDNWLYVVPSASSSRSSS